MSNYHFQLELRLKELDPELSFRHTSCMPVFKQMLKKFLAVFPKFTDHTLLHTMNVTNYANHFLGSAAQTLNAQEIYLFLMASALHDIGMGVTDRDFDRFINDMGLRDYAAAHPEVSKPALIRMYHNDFSAAFVEKHWQILEIPNARYAKAIAQVSRGHRKADLMDETQYPTVYEVDEGKAVNVALLAAILRIADELDVASDRNPELLYHTNYTEGMNQKDIFEFAKHRAISAVDISDDVIIITAVTEQPDIARGVEKAARTIENTLQYCCSVIRERSDMRLADRHTKLILNHKEIPL